MIMRVTWGKILPGKWDQYEKLWNQMAADTKSTKGLKGRVLLKDTSYSDAGYSLSIWESNRDFENYIKSHPISKEMQDCFVGQYITTVCEVRGSELPGLKLS